MGKILSICKRCFYIAAIALLFSSCSEKTTTPASPLTKFSEQQFKSVAQEFAQKLFAKNYTAAYPYFSKDLQKKMTLQQLQSGYENLLRDSELSSFTLQTTDNYNLTYEKQTGGMTIGTGEKLSDFDAVGAQVVIEGLYGEGEGSYTAYYIDFTVEDGALKISEIDFFGHH